MAEKKYYKLNRDNKTITLDPKVKATELEKETVQMYVNAGYIIRIKSEKRAESAKKRVIENGGRIGKKKETKDKE